MGESGTDIKIDKDHQHKFPYGIECKNVESLNVWKAWEQTVANAGNLVPLLFIKKNRKEQLVVLTASEFFNIYAGIK